MGSIAALALRCHCRRCRLRWSNRERRVLGGSSIRRDHADLRHWFLCAPRVSPREEVVVVAGSWLFDAW